MSEVDDLGIVTGLKLHAGGLNELLDCGPGCKHLSLIAAEDRDVVRIPHISQSWMFASNNSVEHVVEI